MDGVAQLYYSKGSVTIHYVGRLTPKPGGVFRVVATAKIVASTGIYAGASGTQSVTGVTKLGAPTGSFHATGTIKY